jgi:diguanylate cyclase (GGDEF)-like protein
MKETELRRRQENLRVLILAQDAGQCWRLQRALYAASRQWQVRSVQNVPHVLEVATETRPDAILMAAHPWEAGIGAVIASIATAQPETAIVVAADTEDVALETVAIVAGAQDVVTIGPDAMESAAAIAGAMRRSVLRQAAIRRAVAEATQDPLTGLWNRRGFERVACGSLVLAGRTGTGALALMWDVDGLKRINDMYGHQEGDKALVLVAHGLRSVLRSSDVAARIGGDEFCALAHGAREADGSAISERVLAWLRANPTGKAGVIGITCGWAEYVPGSEEPLEALLARADAAMYVHKRKATE